MARAWVGKGPHEPVAALAAFQLALAGQVFHQRVDERLGLPEQVGHIVSRPRQIGSLREQIERCRERLSTRRVPVGGRGSRRCPCRSTPSGKALQHFPDGHDILVAAPGYCDRRQRAAAPATWFETVVLSAGPIVARTAARP